MSLRVLIAENERLDRERLSHLLREEPDVAIVSECATGIETLAAIRDLSPDLVFLAIRMPGLDGFEVIRALNSERAPLVIFVSAHDHFALEAFEEHALDFLLKPFDRERFQKALRRARERVATKRKRRPFEEFIAEIKSLAKGDGRLAIRSRGRVYLVRPAEIGWIQGAQNYCKVHVGQSTHLARQSLTMLENQLPSGKFVRISRSLLVNVDYIKEIRPKTHGDSLVVLRDKTELTGSRNFREGLQRLFGKIE